MHVYIRTFYSIFFKQWLWIIQFQCAKKNDSISFRPSREKYSTVCCMEPWSLSIARSRVILNTCMHSNNTVHVLCNHPALSLDNEELPKTFKSLHQTVFSILSIFVLGREYFLTIDQTINYQPALSQVFWFLTMQAIHFNDSLNTHTHNSHQNPHGNK